MSKFYEYLDEFDDRALISVHFNSIKLLRERGLYNNLKTESKKRIKKSRLTTNNFKLKKVKSNMYDLTHKRSDSCLINILNDDWDYLFPGDYDTEKCYYVYYHTNPNNLNHRYVKDNTEVKFIGKPFYIGKGKGDRLYNLNRNKSHLNKIKELQDYGFILNDIAHIFIDGLNERDALILEAKLITFFGCKNELSNKKHFSGEYGGILFNTDFSKRPKWIENNLKKL